MRNRRGFGLILGNEVRSAPVPVRKAAPEAGAFRMGRRRGGGTSELAGSEVPFEGRDSSQEGVRLVLRLSLRGTSWRSPRRYVPEGPSGPKLSNPGAISAPIETRRSQTKGRRGRNGIRFGDRGSEWSGPPTRAPSLNGEKFPEGPTAPARFAVRRSDAVNSGGWK